jgi:hypothetical protein
MGLETSVGKKNIKEKHRLVASCPQVAICWASATGAQLLFEFFYVDGDVTIVCYGPLLRSVSLSLLFLEGPSPYFFQLVAESGSCGRGRLRPIGMGDISGSLAW